MYTCTGWNRPAGDPYKYRDTCHRRPCCGRCNRESTSREQWRIAALISALSLDSQRRTRLALRLSLSDAATQFLLWCEQFSYDANSFSYGAS